MQTKLATIFLLGFVLIAAAACSGGDDAKIADLEERVEAAEEAREEAERRAAEEEAKRKEEEEARKKAEQEAAETEAAEERAEAAEREAAEAEQRRLEAEQAAQQAREEAERRIEEAEQQADANVRASALITALGTTVPTATEGTMGVTHMRGESLTFSRPSALPAKGPAPGVPGSWRSASYSGPRGSVGTDTVYLYTNIQAPSSKAFWKVHGESVTGLTGTASGFTGTPMVTVSGFGTTAKELYPATDGTPDQTGTTSGADKGRSIGGTYDGYSGTFKCDASCDIEAAADGALTFHGTWTFAAGLTAKRSSKRAEQDSEFLYFGIWAYEPTDPAVTHEFKWAAGGDSNEGDAGIGNFGDLTGEATFTGGAIGKYALAKATGRGARAARTGTFTATANFTAVFGSSPTLSGRITNFKEGGTSLGEDWNIFLGEDSSSAADLTATGVALQGTGAHGAIDGDTASGAWMATLHGSDNHEFTDRTKYPASKYPVADVAGVAGWFRANAGTNAAIAGAFGAACTTGTMCAK